MSQPPGSPPALAPPYPSLGPVALPEAENFVGVWLTLAVLTTLGLVFALLAWQIRRARSRRPEENPRPSRPPVREEFEGPRRECVELAERFRDLVSDRFAGKGRSHTTDELSLDPELREWLGSEAEAWVALLRLADLAKFAGDEFDRALEGIPPSNDLHEMRENLDGLARRSVEPLAPSIPESPATSRATADRIGPT